MRSNPPSWCADSWCYVDKANCNLPISNSVFFPGLVYSYFTCGASNTFESWFPSAESGSGEAHALTDLVTLMKTYTQTISDTLEENFIEAAQSGARSQPSTTADTATVSSATR